MSYLELVEEFPRFPEYTQFEKILAASKRAKDLHNEDRAPLVLADRTAAYAALQELKEGKIKMVYREEPAPEMIEQGEGEESEDEEE